MGKTKTKTKQATTNKPAAAGPTCPYCHVECEPHGSNTFMLRFECPTCVDSVKEPRPEIKRRLDLATPDVEVNARPEG